MVYLSFQLKDIGFGREFSKEDTLTMETRNLQVCWDENYLQLIDKIGSFGRTGTQISEIKGIRTMFNKELLFILVGFKLDPNFTFRVYVDKAPDWLCVKPNYYGEERGDETWLDFAHYGASLTLIKHPLSNDRIREIKDLKELINSLVSRAGAESKEKLERICQLIENNQIYKDYKKKINDRQLIELSTNLQQWQQLVTGLGTELLNEKNRNTNLQQELAHLQNELTIMEREKVQEQGAKKIKEIVEQKDKKIKELEDEKTKNVDLQKEHLFYKQFFSHYLQSKKTELDKLKSELNKEEKEWLDIYWEANQETEQSFFVKKQLKRAKENLKEKFSEKELELILEKQAEINQLENQLSNLQIQENPQGDSSTQVQIEIPPK